MNHHEATSVIEHAKQLWTEARLTDAELLAWTRDLCRYAVSVAQAKVVLDAVRVERGRRKPPMQEIAKRLRAVAQAQASGRRSSREAQDEPNPDPPPNSFEAEAAEKFRQDPANPRWDRYRQRMARVKGLTEVARQRWLRHFGSPTPFDRS